MKRSGGHAALRELHGSEEMTPQDLREIFSYDPETGELRWKTRVSLRFHIGELVGSIDSHGYRRVTVRGRHLKCHRIAWAMVHGEWPAEQVDHVDGNRANNAIANLREATNAQNNWNINHRSLGASGYRGVQWNKADKRWRASITVNKRTIYLGQFKTAEEASRAYLAAKATHHGEFATTVLATTAPESDKGQLTGSR
jgi:hypothetical protein